MAAPTPPGRPVSAWLQTGWALTAATALIGPILAVPGAPQLFAFRLLVIFFAAAGVVAIGADRLRVAGSPASVELALLGAWGAILVAGIGWSEDTGTAIRYVLLFATFAAFAAGTALACASGPRLRAVLRATLVALALAVAAGLIEAATGFQFPRASTLAGPRDFQTGVRGFFDNPNNFATTVVLGIAFLVAAAIHLGRPGRVALAAIGIPAAPALVLSGSRGSLVALALVVGAAVVVLMTDRTDRRRRRAGRIVAVLLVVGVVGVGAVAATGVSSLRAVNVQKVLSEAQAGQGSGSVRVGLAREGVSLVTDSGGRGVGPGQAENLILLAGGVGGRVNLHFFFLEVLVDGGVLAFAAFAALYVLLLVRTLRTSRRARDPWIRTAALGSFLALVGFLIGNLGPSGAIAFAPMWLTFGIAMAAHAAGALEPPQRAPAASR